ncbi:MAG: M20/M25/M40 family metallo-hydrolase [Chloroflexota bacterium]|nr:M20/M25/M40 family metallo-hydrolase [Chloroflexota bacterium]
MESANHISSIYQHPALLLQRLIQFNTTNPPGNESECISFINGMLTEAGIETRIFAKSPQRPNLVARLSGKGNALPLLLYGHVDVVTTENQEWRHPPFEGKLVDDFVWGRGALDMKGGVAMMLAAFLRAKTEGLELPGDVLFAALSDEEAGGDFGARYLVEKHADLFNGIRYAIGEFGGFTMHVGKQRFYPIQVAEKQVCWIKATVHGPGGHGSLPVRGGAMARLSELLRKIDQHRLPVHVTPVARLMFKTIAASVGGLTGLILRQLTCPILTDSVLNQLGERGRLFSPLLHNTVSATILHGSEKINVIPSVASVEIDGRLLPGCQPADMIRELRQIIGEDVELEVVRHDPGPSEPDMGLFDMLADILVEFDPGGVPVPLLLSGVTDGRFFSRLGIQTYGFLPMTLPEDFSFAQTIHAADERIPAGAVGFGANAIYKALQRFGT